MNNKTKKIIIIIIGIVIFIGIIGAIVINMTSKSPGGNPVIEKTNEEGYEIPDPEVMEGTEFIAGPDPDAILPSGETPEAPEETGLMMDGEIVEEIDWEEIAKRTPEEQFRKGVDIMGNPITKEQQEKWLAEIEDNKDRAKALKDALDDVNYEQKYKNYSYNKEDLGFSIKNGIFTFDEDIVKNPNIIKLILNRDEEYGKKIKRDLNSISGQINALGLAYGNNKFGIKPSKELSEGSQAYSILNGQYILSVIDNLSITDEELKRNFQYMKELDPTIKKETLTKDQLLKDMIIPSIENSMFEMTYLDTRLQKDYLYLSTEEKKDFKYPVFEGMNPDENELNTEIGSVMLGNYSVGIDKNYVIVSVLDSEEFKQIKDKKVLKKLIGANIFDISQLYK